MTQNYRLIAIQAGDLLKCATTVNEVNRAAKSIFRFECEPFPNDAITSVRSKRIHDWVLSLAKQMMNEHERNHLLVKFLSLITSDDLMDSIEGLLTKAGIHYTDPKVQRFKERRLHEKINKNCKKLFSDEHYFHAVFEAVKIYHRLVQKKSNLEKEGFDLMMQAWKTEGVLKITNCETETDKNVQDGVAFLSSGLMRAIRNPTAHEPAHLWPISEEDCLNILSFITFLLKKLDESVYFNNSIN